MKENDVEINEFQKWCVANPILPIKEMNRLSRTLPTRCKYLKQFPTQELQKIEAHRLNDEDISVACYDWEGTGTYRYRIFFINK